MLFLLGVVLLFAGCPLVLLPRVRLSRTWIVPKRAAHLAGGLLVAFFPAVLLTSLVLRLFGWDDVVSAEAIYWALFAACVIGGTSCLLLVDRAARLPIARRPPAPTNGPPPLPVAEAPADFVIAPTEPPPSARNPFDFS